MSKTVRARRSILFRKARRESGSSSFTKSRMAERATFRTGRKAPSLRMGADGGVGLRGADIWMRESTRLKGVRAFLSQPLRPLYVAISSSATAFRRKMNVSFPVPSP